MSVQSTDEASPPADSATKALPVMRPKRAGRRSVFGRLQREAARRRRTDRRLAVFSVVVLLGLLALFYRILAT
jgi:hypothetical protein